MGHSVTRYATGTWEHGGLTREVGASPQISVDAALSCKRVSRPQWNEGLLRAAVIEAGERIT